MKPSKISASRFTYVIDMDIANHSVNFRIVHDLEDGTRREFVQNYNLDVIPLEAAMSQICGLLLPRNK